MSALSDAELRAGGEALDAWLIGLGLPASLVQAARPYGAATAVLDAVLPDHDARVRKAERARVAEEIAQVAEAYALRLHGTAAAVLRAGAHHAVAMIRQHATTPTAEEDPDA